MSEGARFSGAWSDNKHCHDTNISRFQLHSLWSVLSESEIATGFDRSHRLAAPRRSGAGYLRSHSLGDRIKRSQCYGGAQAILVICRHEWSFACSGVGLFRGRF
jgi:hypothetical protein